MPPLCENQVSGGTVWRNETLNTNTTGRTVTAATLSLILVACGGDSGADETTSGVTVAGDSGSAQSSMTLASNGPAVCFEAAAEALGADAKVSELSTSFGVGENLEQYAVVSTEPGILKSCSVKYQDPENANKLLQRDLDVTTGEFKDPQPIEISVIGSAADFSLEDFLIPLSSINASAIADRVSEQEALLDETFSSHALSRVSLQSPGPGSAVHRISVNFEGRLKSNDILDSGGIGLNLDGSVDYNNIGK